MLILRLIYLLVDAFRIILFLYCIFSWFVHDPFNKFYRFLSSICDPLLKPVRKLLGMIPFLQACPIDFSPVVLLMLISFLVSLL